MASVKKFIHRLLYTDGMTPLPGKTMIALFSINFFGCMTSTMCFSYLPKLVKSYGVSEVETGAYAGYIASSAFVGVLFCSLLWGHFGDKKGDKLALLLASSFLMLWTLAFGFSTNYWWTVSTRFLQGTSIGFVVVAKSILANNLDDTNRSLGFTLFFTAWTTALIIGPTMAGFLVFPVEQYPATFSKDSLFGRFHILLPNLIVGICLGISILLALFLLPNDKKKNKSSEEVCLLDETGEYKSYMIDNKNDIYCKLSLQEKSFSKKLETSDTTKSTTTFLQRILPNGVISALSLFRSKDFTLSVCLYGFEGFCMIGLEEIFPVFATTSRLYNGLELSTAEVGAVLLGASIIMLIVQVMITSKINKKIGARKMLIGGSLLTCVSTALTPTIAAFKTKRSVMIAAIFAMFVNQILLNGILISVNILVNNSVTPDVYGLANGIGLSISAVGRMCAPTTFGNIFSWSLTNVKGIQANSNPLGFPFNEFFTFFALSFSFFMCALIAIFGLSKEADVTKDLSSEEDADSLAKRTVTVKCSLVHI